MSTIMTPRERETFLQAVHVAVLSIAQAILRSHYKCLWVLAVSAGWSVDVNERRIRIVARILIRR